MTDPTASAAPAAAMTLQDWITTGETVALDVAPFIPGNAGILLAAALTAAKAVQTATASQVDVTDAQLAGFFDDYKAAQVADDAAEAAAGKST